MCDFVPEDPRDHPEGGVDCISFSSARVRDLHVGVRPNGELKEPKNTGNGVHGQFTVTVCDKILY